MSTNKVIFFIMLGLFFMLFFYLTGFCYLRTDPTSSIKRMVVVLLASVIFSLLFVVYTQLTDLFKKEGFHFTSGAKKCRGGPYMWQGSSEKAKFCRNLASTPEGADEINSYQCNTGYTGMPGCNFKFTPMSNDLWQNEMCDS